MPRMTEEEKRAKQIVTRVLYEDGRIQYAKLFSLYDLNLTDDPSAIAYTVQDKALIVLNRGLFVKDYLTQLSVIVRHEILHQQLKHFKRMEKHLGSNIDLGDHTAFNIAADYEISNLSYTEEDKKTLHNIVMGLRVLSALVTEDDHPDWVNLTMEEMYDKIVAEQHKQDKDIDKLKNQLQKDQQKDQQKDGQGQDGQGSNDLDNKDSNKDNQKGNNSQKTKDDSGQQGQDQKGDSKSFSKFKIPQIGDRGNPEIQKAEDVARQAQISKELAKKAQKGLKKAQRDAKDGDVDSDNLEKAFNDAEKAEEQAEKLANDAENQDSNMTQEELDDLQRRVEKLNDLLGDAQITDALKKEDLTANEREQAEKIRKQQEQKAKDELERRKIWGNSELIKDDDEYSLFRQHLDSFVASVRAPRRQDTWRKFNAAYVNSPLLRQGHQYIEKTDIPRINVYFDQSGSWDNNKIARGVRTLGALEQLNREKKINLKVYYFAGDNEVKDSPDKIRVFGTLGTPIVNHIKETNPQNVIIMTDSDIVDITEKVEVPGAVWILFYNGVSENVMQKIQGVKETRAYSNT